MRPHHRPGPGQGEALEGTQVSGLSAERSYPVTWTIHTHAVMREKQTSVLAQPPTLLGLSATGASAQ